RFTYRHELIPFPYNESGMELFRQFLSDIESQLPLEAGSGLAEKSLAERIYYATDGTIAHVMTLIRKGATLAIRQDLDCLNLEILNAVYHKHLKHEKPLKFTEPFLVNNFDLESSYALDKSKQRKINKGNNIKGVLRA
ncbi:MAG: transposase, partial [Cyanobacteria bacterium P01_A01_bin.83]